MKSILLTSTALVAFAGSAAAEAHTGVNFGGGAEMSYNDETGFDWSADMTIMFDQELNGGLMVGADFSVDLADAGGEGAAASDEGKTVVSTDFLLSLESDLANLRFGATAPAAELWFDDVDGMEFPGFNDQDVHLDTTVDTDGDGEADAALFDAILYGDVTYGPATLAVSGGLDAGGESIDALQVGAAATFGSVSLTAGYQEAFGGTDDVYAVSAAASFAGADIQVAYGAETDGESSTGIDVAYPVGPVVIGGYYTMNDIAEDNYGLRADYVSGSLAVSAFYDVDGGEAGAEDDEDYGVEASYDLNNGLVLFAGAVDSFDDYYAAAEYDLGGGAEAFVQYVEDGGDQNADNEIGADDRERGTTIGVSFSF